MTNEKFTYPTAADIRKLEIEAQKMRGEYLRAAFAGAWAAFRSLFAGAGAPANAS